jgi:hypothetical protein
MSDNAVFCIVNRRSHIEAILNRLRAAGFGDSSISVLVAQKSPDGDIEIEGHTKAPEGAAAGGGSGLLAGGALGWMAGMGVLGIPGLGPFIAAGPIMAALSGAAIGSATGGIIGALIGAGLSEFEAKRYEAHLQDGNALISVHAHNEDEVERAKAIYYDEEAGDVSVQKVVSIND